MVGNIKARYNSCSQFGLYMYMNKIPAEFFSPASLSFSLHSEAYKLVQGIGMVDSMLTVCSGPPSSRLILSGETWRNNGHGDFPQIYFCGDIYKCLGCQWDFNHECIDYTLCHQVHSFTLGAFRSLWRSLCSPLQLSYPLPLSPCIRSF